MWAFLPGVKKPEKDSSQNAKRREYEANRKERSFKESWKVGRPWLIFEDGAMFCTYCKSANVLSDFAKGSKSFRLDSIKKHEVTESHKHSTTIAENQAKEVGKRPSEQALQTLNKENFQKLSILFKSAHAIALKNRPFSDFSWMCDLDKAKGLNIGNTYINDKSCRVFIKAIANVERQKICDVITKSKFLSILVDGSMDSAIIDNEIIYLRCTINGTQIVKFIGCMSVQKADANGILDSMRRAVISIGLDWHDVVTKIISLGSDGASVMVGHRGGVAALLKEMHPSIISVHCMAHRLELAYKAALKDIKVGEKVITGLLMGLYYFYSNSPLNRSNLKESFRSLNLNTKIPTRVGGTRWISHVLLALKNFFHGYQAIKQHLNQITHQDNRGVQSTAKNKAIGLLRLAENESVLLFAAFLVDILSVLSITSRTFQKADGCAADVHRALKSAKSSIENLEERNGPYLEKVVTGQIEGMNVRDDASESPPFLASKSLLITRMKEAVSSRFSDANSGIIKASIISDFKCWPNKELANHYEIQDFGNEDVKTILKHFGNDMDQAGVEIDIVEHEWSLLKSDVYQSYNDVNILSWKEINQRFQQQHPNILSLFDLLLTIPSSSADCERGFSHMKNIKTDQRNRLTEASLNDVMMIRLESDSIKTFDPTSAIHNWNTTAGQRRSDFNDKRKRHQKHGHNDKQVKKRFLSGEAAEAEETDETDRIEEIEDDIEMIEIESENESESGSDVSMSEDIVQNFIDVMDDEGNL